MDANITKLIEELTNRLDYLTFEVPEEEFNVAEIKPIVSLLEIYEPSKEKFNVKESYQKILEKMQHYNQKEKGSKWAFFH